MSKSNDTFNKKLQLLCLNTQKEYTARVHIIQRFYVHSIVSMDIFQD